MKEFDFINTCLKPLEKPRTFDDDTSLELSGQRLIVNTDTIVEGRHYLPNDPADSVAKKLLRVGISDLASTGGKPVDVSLALALGDGVTASWLKDFTSGLAEDLALWKLRLIGGDTTRVSGASVLSAMITGDLENRQPMRRWQAQAGDRVWLGQPLGRGGLGLCDAKQGRSTPLAWAYRVPMPQLELGIAIASTGHRIACVDVSDGLGADLGHIARASQVRIHLRNVPVEPGGDMNAGDDYCLVAATSADLSLLGMVEIGEVMDGMASVWLDGQDISQCGYEHA